MELEVSRNVSAHAHGEEKYKMNFRNEHVSSVCQRDYTSPSHVGSWEGWAQLSCWKPRQTPDLQRYLSGMPECCLSQGCARPCSVSAAPQLPPQRGLGSSAPRAATAGLVYKSLFCPQAAFLYMGNTSARCLSWNPHISISWEPASPSK